jgi:MFS family permease
MTEQKPGFFYGWIILAVGFAVSFSWGVFYSYGVFLKPLAADLSQSRGLISSVFSVFLAGSAVSGILMGRLTDKYGTRLPLSLSGFLITLGLLLCSQIHTVWQLYLFYGIASLGAGVTFTLPPATAQRWFFKRRGLALSILAAGTGIGGVVFAPLIAHLISSHGWRFAFIIMGAITFVIFLIAALMTSRSPEEKGLKAYGAEEVVSHSQKGEGVKRESKWKERELIRTKAFGLTNAIYFFSIVPNYLVTVHIPSFASDIGFSEEEAALILGLIFGVSIVGRITGGPFAEKIGWGKAIFVCSAVCAAMLIWLAVTGGSQIYLFAIIYGFFFGCRVPMLPGIVGFLFGTEFLAGLLGIISISGSLGAAVGPSLGGFIFDRTGSYYIAFLAGAFSWALSGIFSLLVKPPQKLEKIT